MSFLYKNDEEMDGSTSTTTAMQESLDEFYAVMQEVIPKWSNGKVANIVRKNEDTSEMDLENMKTKAGLSREQALDEVFMANPELTERCEKED